MEKTFLLDFVKNIFEQEIANNFILDTNSIVINLTNGTKAKISSRQVSKNYSPISVALANNDYVLKHDYGYGQDPEVKQLNKLSLRHIEDLFVYLIDACQTQLQANCDNLVIDFGNENRFFLDIAVI